MNKNMTTQSAEIREENCDAEEGSTTVEYAIGALATAGFAGLLLVVLKSGVVQSALEHLISTALSFSRVGALSSPCLRLIERGMKAW